MDLLDLLTEWQRAVADVRACTARCEADEPADYFCAVPIEHEKDARAAFHREMDRRIAAKLASL
jgi:hypothetical protein